jgi:glycerol-3-phosphate dehydrogenase
MAQQTLQFIRPDLPSHTHPDRSARAFDRLNCWDFAAQADQMGLDPALQLRLLGRYGHAAIDLLCTAGANELSPIANTPFQWAELRWAARTEQVVHLEDLLLRRSRLGLLLPCGGIGELPRIRSICQPELGWDDQHWQSETAAYIDLWQRAYSPPGFKMPDGITASVQEETFAEAV